MSPDIKPRQPWALKMLAVAAHAAGRWLVWLQAGRPNTDDADTLPGKVRWCPECLNERDDTVPIDECEDHRGNRW